MFGKLYRKNIPQNVWARPGMRVTFRVEVMPGRSREERSFVVEKVLPNGRVALVDFNGEHHESVFEPTTCGRPKP